MLTEERLQSTQLDQLPAGGSDPTRFDWKEAWYPVHYIEDLDKSKLTRFTLLDRDLVIWWDQKASCWRALDDQCPHRLAPLSEGRIAEDGLLECPYHGWAFREMEDAIVFLNKVKIVQHRNPSVPALPPYQLWNVRVCFLSTQVDRKMLLG